MAFEEPGDSTEVNVGKKSTMSSLRITRAPMCGVALVTVDRPATNP